MGVFNLEKIFAPASVAVVGASETRGSIGRALMENLTEHGYEGQIIPVNPKYSEIVGIRSFETLTDAGKNVDLALIATPISTVPGIVEECVEIGVGGAIVISAGGRETGEEGEQVEAKIAKKASKGRLRIIGPNCMGILCPEQKLNASFAAHMPLLGPTAFISQSGAICSAMLDLALKENMGFRYFVSIGSMLDVDFGDLIDYLGNDPDVTNILLYIESLTHIRKFMSAARAVSRIKPIVVLKAGRSPEGARAAASHTGALAGDELVYEAAFKRAGIASVRTLEDFFDCAEMLAKQSPPSGRRLVVVTNAGGPGVMAADAIVECGLELSTLKEGTLAKLNKILPPYWSRGNPVDILGDATSERYRDVTGCLFDVEEIDGMLVIVNPQAMTDPSEVAGTLAKDLKQRPYPVFTALMGGADVEEGLRILNKEGIPTYGTPERAVRAFAVLYDYARNLELLQEIPPRFNREVRADEDEAGQLVQGALEKQNGFLSEIESKRLLASYGIPVNRSIRAGSMEEAVRVAKGMGYPLVMKILSPDITHKSDAGGVRTNIEREEEVREAYKQVTESAWEYDPDSEILGVTLQPMVQNAEVELLVGAKRTKQFGPVILFGMGGFFAELIGDRAIALPPLNRTLARRLMEGAKAYRLLKGYRNMPEADLDLLERLLLCLSHLLVDFPEIAELDMNPVLLEEGRPVAVDARVRIQKPETPAPHHLVISPYPAQYESEEMTTGGVHIFIRPIKPEDAPMLMKFFENLSTASRYHRFFGATKSLSRDMLLRFTQIDYDRHIALLAFNRETEKEMILGGARVIIGPDRRKAEFSVTVADPWQGKGVGRKLLERCLDACRDYGIGTVQGEVLAENTQMINLGRRVGFHVSRGEDASAYRLTIDL
ncbi:MAG: GNAT family N-acetyltransferase [Desulfatiglandales bacterium]